MWVLSGAPRTPALQWRQRHEQIGRPIFNTSDISDVSYAFVFAVEPCRLSRLHRNRFSRFLDQSLRGFVEAPRRHTGIARRRINSRNVLHRRYARAVRFERDDPPLSEVKLERVFLARVRSYYRRRDRRCGAPRLCSRATVASGAHRCIACTPPRVCL